MRTWISNHRNLVCLGGSIIFFLIAVLTYLDSKPLNQTNNTLTVGVFTDSFWNIQNGNTYKILDASIAKLKEENPNIEVTYETGILKKDYSEWLFQKLIQEDGPDLFFILPDDFNKLVELNALEDLTSVIDLQEEGFTDSFYSSALSSGEYENNQYALPYECAPKLMFVNQTLLDKEGIPLPSENWTWDDFYKICNQVTKDTDNDGTIDQFGYVGYDYEDAFNSNNVELFSENGHACNLTEDRVIESLEFLEKLKNININVSDKDFDLGTVAFQPMSFSEFRAYQPYPLSLKKYENFDWGCLLMPRGPSGNNVSGLECLQIGINSKTKNFLPAWELMKILTSDPEIQKQIFDYSEGVSVLKSVTEKDETLGNLIESSNSPLTQEILSHSVENAVTAPRFSNYSLAKIQVDQAIDTIINSNENLESSLIQWNRTINQSLKNDYVDQID